MKRTASLARRIFRATTTVAVLGTVWLTAAAPIYQHT